MNASWSAILKWLTMHTLMIFIMKYPHNNLLKIYILIILYNYIVCLHEMTWCINQFVYVGIAKKLSSIVNGLGFP